MNSISLSLSLLGKNWPRLLFLVFSPILSLLLTVIFLESLMPNKVVRIFNNSYFSPFHFLVLQLTQGHIFLVIYRAYLNKRIFNRHRVKFLVFPVVLFFSGFLSEKFFVLSAVLYAFWVHFHYCMQNYGISRMLSLRPQGSSKVLDTIFNFSVYFLPIFIGNIGFVININRISPNFEFLQLGLLKLIVVKVVGMIANWENVLTWTFHSISIIYLLLLFGKYLRREEKMEKVCYSFSLWISFTIGWIIMNPIAGMYFTLILHSLQYYYLIVDVEKDNFGHLKGPMIRPVYQVTMIVSALAFGFFAINWGTGFVPLEVVHNVPLRIVYSIVFSMNLLHFWLDGYIWRKER